MASEKIREFILENFKWGEGEQNQIADDEVITEAIIMYRKVRVTTEEDGLPERCDYLRSRGCSFVMALGVVQMVTGEWEYKIIRDIYEEDEDGEDD